MQPAWYFLFAYAILPYISNKLGGTAGLFLKNNFSPKIYYNFPYFH